MTMFGSEYDKGEKDTELDITLTMFGSEYDKGEKDTELDIAYMSSYSGIVSRKYFCIVCFDLQYFYSSSKSRIRGGNGSHFRIIF